MEGHSRLAAVSLKADEKAYLSVATTDLSRSIEYAFMDLIKGLQRLESTRNVTVGQESYITRALEFVKGNQNADGSWGLGAMIDMNMSLQALGIWVPHQDTWITNAGSAGGIELAFDWLDRTQEHGAWDTNIWDTAATIQAASLHNRLHRESIQRAIQWLTDQKRSKWGLDNGLPPHYAAQALIAFVRAGGHQDEVDVLQSILLAEARTNLPRIQKSLYISGQVLQALTLGGIAPTSDIFTHLISSVKDGLVSIEVSIANFLDICAGFAGLGTALGGIDPEESAIQVTLGNLFNPNRLRRDGSWYHDLTLSGWALVALEQVQEVRKIDAYPQRIYSLVKTAADEIRSASEDMARQKRSAFAYSLLLCVSAIFTIFALYPVMVGPVTIRGFPTSDIAYFVAPIGITLVGIAVRKLAELLK